MKKKRTLCVLCGAAFLFMIYLAATALSIWRYASVDEKQPADTAIVLGAGTAGGEISPGSGFIMAFGCIKTDMWMR